MDNRCMIEVEWGETLATALGLLLTVVFGWGVFSAFGGLWCWLSEVEDSTLILYARAISLLLGVISIPVYIFLAFTRIIDFFTKLLSGRVRVYLNGRLVASGKANVYFYVPLSRPGDIYEGKWGRETFSLRLYPRTHYTISKGDFGWGYRD